MNPAAVYSKNSGHRVKEGLLNLPPLNPIPTGNDRVDQVVTTLVGEVELLLPSRAYSLYLFGSYADGSATAASDIDLFVVLRDELATEELDQVRQLSEWLSVVGGCHIDLLPVAENQLRRDGHWRLEANSLLVAGQDLRPALPHETLAGYLRRYSHAPYAYMAQVLRQTDRLIYPVDAPSPSGEFGGYVEILADQPGESTKAFVATVCWIATLLTGFGAGRKVASRHGSARAYRDALGGAWAGFVDEVYRLGKERWSYRVPEYEPDRSSLRRLTSAMPAFENHYLAVYRAFLLHQLVSPDTDARLEAVERLRAWVIFSDDAVREVLSNLAERDEDERVRSGSRATLAEIARVTGTG